MKQPGGTFHAPFCFPIIFFILFFHVFSIFTTYEIEN